MAVALWDNAPNAILGLAFGVFTGVAQISVLKDDYVFASSHTTIPAADRHTSFPFFVAETLVGLESGSYTLDHTPHFSLDHDDRLPGTAAGLITINALALDHPTAGLICYYDDFPPFSAFSTSAGAVLPGCAADPLGWLRAQLITVGNSWYRSGLKAILDLAFKAPGTGIWTVIGVTSAYTFDADHVIGDITNQVATSTPMLGFTVSNGGVHNTSASFDPVNNGTVAGLVLSHSVHGPVAFTDDFTPYATDGSGFLVGPSADGWIKLVNA